MKNLDLHLIFLKKFLLFIKTKNYMIKKLKNKNKMKNNI